MVFTISTIKNIKILIFSNEKDEAKQVGAPTRLVLKSFVVKLKKAVEEKPDLEQYLKLCTDTISTIEANLKA